MFTGIIQSQGKVTLCRTGKDGKRLGFRFLEKTGPLQLGESIAVNGVCLTVVKKQGLVFEVDTIWQTLDATTLADLKVGDPVNLERSLRYGDFMGGHFVTGHVDAVGKIQKITKRGDSWDFTIQVPKSVADFIVTKGSIAVEGISLTVQKRTKNSFSVGIIPHTYEVTTLGQKKSGEGVNLEVDLLARYGQKRRSSSRAQKRSLAIKDFLVHGF